MQDETLVCQCGQQFESQEELNQHLADANHITVQEENQDEVNESRVRPLTEKDSDPDSLAENSPISDETDLTED